MSILKKIGLLLIGEGEAQTDPESGVDHLSLEERMALRRDMFLLVLRQEREPTPSSGVSLWSQHPSPTLH